MRSFISLVTLTLSAIVATAAPTPEAGELEARQSCPDVQVYFARGTTEVGTLGTVVGPSFSTALNVQLVGKNVRFTGIDYPALVSGYLAGGDAGGARTMANSVTSTANSCPNTKIVISGYRLVLCENRFGTGTYL
jgi:cutinase